MHTWMVVSAKPGRSVPTEVVELLDDPSPHDLFFPPSRHHRWSSTTGHVHAAGWAVGSVNVGVGSFWEQRASGITAFSGHVWVDATAWRPGSSWASQLADRYDTHPIDDDVERLDGIFTLLHLDASGSGWITADPLGAGMVYRAQTPEVVVFGNRAALVAAAVTPRGRRPRRDTEAMAFLGYTGTLQGDRTGFDGVRTIPQAAIVRLRPGAEPTVDQWSELPWWTETDPEAADELLDRAIVRMRAKARLMAALPAQFNWVEITGGKDSRLVLALLLAEELQNDVRFQCWGSKGSPAAVVAQSLAERFDLTLFVEGQKPGGRGQHFPRQDLPMEQLRWRRRVLDYREQLEHHLWVSGGGLSVWNLKQIPWPPARTSSISGLFGEMLRTNYARTDGLDSVDGLRRFLDVGGFRFDGAGLMTRDAATHAREVVEAELLSLLPPSGDVLDAVDGFYQRGRLRRWAGGLNEVGERNRVFPLYDLAGTRAAFAVGSRWRRAELVPYRILERCRPELARVPFDNDAGWPAALLDGRPDAADHPRLAPVRPWTERTLVGASKVWNADAALVRSRSSRTAKFRRLKAPTAAEQGRMAGFDEKREVLREFLDLPKPHPVWDLFDRTRTHRALDRIEELSGRGREQVHDVVSVAMWLDHRDRKVDTLLPVDP